MSIYHHISTRSLVIYLALPLLAGYLLIKLSLFQQSPSLLYDRISPEMDIPRSADIGMNEESSSSQKPTRMPVYFLGIGGPNFMENTKHPAYQKLQTVGKEITTQVKPKAVVVFSAHWQAGPDRIEINVAENVPLIYDFYGFPPHYYQYEYPSKGSPDIAKKVIDHLDRAGIEVDRVKRGLDHGVWVGFLAGKSQLPV